MCLASCPQDGTGPLEGFGEELELTGWFKGEAAGKIIESEGRLEESKSLMWCDAGVKWVFLEMLQDKTKREALTLAVVRCP